jgi:hypothetical protein
MRHTKISEYSDASYNGQVFLNLLRFLLIPNLPAVDFILQTNKFYNKKK